MAFAGLGGLLLLIGTIWLIVIAIQTGTTTGEKVIWALVNFFCQPLGGIIFYVLKKQGLSSAYSGNNRRNPARHRQLFDGGRNNE